jgi:site-specific recombinase XerD
VKAMTYHEEEIKMLSAKLNEKLKILPKFCTDFAIGIEPRTEIKTRLGYISDVSLFFEYLSNVVQKNIKEVKDLENVRKKDIEGFLNYLNATNSNNGKKRKLAAIRRLFKYFNINEEPENRIENNPALAVETPRVPKKKIIFLKENEQVNLIDAVKSGSKNKFDEVNGVEI